MPLRAVATLPGRKINITNHAGVVHLSTPLALRDLLAQIRQPNIGTIALN
jgi:hypothetical protein